MSSRRFDPPVYKDTYTSGLKSSGHSHKGDRILCCGIPCWLQILIWTALLTLVIIGAVYLYQRHTGQKVDLRTVENPN